MSARTILHAEDDENEAFLLAHALRKHAGQYRLQQVHDGEIAIDYLTGHGEFADRFQHPLPSAILLDLKMPRRNGFEVLEWLRAQPGMQTLPVIVLTSSERPEDKARAFQLGATAYVTKSFDWASVLRELDQVLGPPQHG
jgi:CheY-like chemotaxis protein